MPTPKKIDFNDLMSGKYNTCEEILNPKEEARIISAKENAMSHSGPIPNPIDFGESTRSIFNRVLKFVDRKLFIYHHTDPCFPDGRGCVNLLKQKGIDNTIQKMSDDAMKDYYLLGYIPWKIFDARYIAEERNPEFLPLIKPRLIQFSNDLERIRNSSNIRNEFNKYDNIKNKKRNEKDKQILIDMLYR
jgi:hypothetical protein